MSGLVSDFFGAGGSAGFLAAIGFSEFSVAVFGGLVGLDADLAGGVELARRFAVGLVLGSFAFEIGLPADTGWLTDFSDFGFPGVGLAGGAILDVLFGAVLFAPVGMVSDLGFGLLDAATEGVGWVALVTFSLTLDGLVDATALGPFDFGAAGFFEAVLDETALGELFLGRVGLGDLVFGDSDFGELDFCAAAFAETALGAAVFGAGLAVDLETGLALAEGEDPLAEDLVEAFGAPGVFFTTAGFLDLA